MYYILQVLLVPAQRQPFTFKLPIPENRQDKELLKHSLSLTREVLNYIDAQVDAREKEQRLIDIYNKIDARSSAMYKGNKFKVGLAKCTAWLPYMS